MLKLSLDTNGALKINPRNVKLILFCLSVDSAYRRAFDIENENSSAYYIKKKLDFDNVNSIKEVCTRINRENSTHLGVANGIELTANQIYILRYNIEARLKSGDDTLVKEIASAVKDRNNFSFASKFCTYVCRYKYKLDNYAIYDDVIQSVLPYYLHKYLNDDTHYRKTKSTKAYVGRKVSTVIDFRKNKNYKDYRA